MWEVARVLEDMCSSQVISGYALFGAVAQMRYTEPVATLDVDVLVAIPGPQGLDVLSGIYSYLNRLGYEPEGEAVRIGNWPVQFIPAFDALTSEALKTAEVEDFEGTPLRVVRPDYLAVIALATGRSKDWLRILALLESGSITRESVGSLAATHGLVEKWGQFQKRFLDER